jgi:hypothetical protein
MQPMHSKFTRGAVAVAGLGLAAGLVAAAPAQAATSTVQVRPADLLAPSDTAGGGVQEFLAQGVHLKTPAAESYARGRFHVGVPLSQVTTVDYTWYGTTFAPGVKHYIDADADGKIDGELRGEKVYGGQDVWLNLDAQDFPDSVLADNFFASHAPCTGNVAAPGVTDPCGSSGNAKHGTLANWAKTLQAATGKAPVLVDGGYALAGAVGDGVLTQITYGPNQYVFTNQAKAKVSIAAKVAHERVKKAQKIRFSGDVEPAATGAKVTLEVKKGGKWTTVKTRNLAASGEFRFGDRPERLGKLRYRVTVTETNATLAATSSALKVLVTRK